MRQGLAEGSILKLARGWFLFRTAYDNAGAFGTRNAAFDDDEVLVGNDVDYL